MFRETWFEIDLDAIAENVRTIKKSCGKKVIAVLKANAYGCGDSMVAPVVVEAGADMIAVSSLDEAIVLRYGGYEGDLLILGAVNHYDISSVIEKNISITVYSFNMIEEISKYDLTGLKVHLKYDTGMNRIGFRQIEEIKRAIDLLVENGAKIEGVFTHFACADSSREMTDRQFLKFAEMVKTVNYPFKWIHCDNSDATLSYPESVSNACRVGISLYGISAVTKDLKPALSFYTKLFFLKSVQKGETIGYGATYTTKQEELIGTIPVGYADGFIRENQGRNVFVEGAYAEVVGRVCMDQSMIRLPSYRPEGSLVEIFGPHIPIEQMAEELHTIPYEIMCLISSRVTRVYIHHGKKVGEENARLDYSKAVSK